MGKAVYGSARVCAVARAFFVAAVTLLCSAGSVSAQTTLISESFEDTSYASRGWYDGTGGALSSVERYSGMRAYECRFAAGGTKCAGGDIGRHKFTATDAVYIRYYIKHTTNWVGSGKSYHPHMFMFTTTVDGDYIGPAYSHLTAYVEENAGTPFFQIQDGRNIDETKIGVDLTRVTENRSVAGCNGDSDGYGPGNCYPAGSVHWNEKWWKPSRVYFDSTPGSPYYKNDWHLIETYFQLNSVQNGTAARDGVIRLWYDGQMIMEQTGVVMRTGANPTMKFNQLQLIPYIGDGSPVDQTIWIDDLLIATGRVGGTSPRPQAPTNVRIIR